MAFLTETRTAPLSPRLLRDAVEAFQHAHEASAQAHQYLTRGQESGVEALPPGVEFLDAEAQRRWDALVTLAGIDAAAGSMVEDAPGEDVASQYARPHVVQEPVEMDWDIDWSRGRR